MDGRRVDGRQLRSLRQRAGLRMAELAELVGCSKGHIRNIETVGDQPGPELAHRFARELSKALDAQPVTLDDFSVEEPSEHARRAS